ncbi:rhomboid family intramembrane serine protease [Thioclava sediminum]|uniref:Rhomboid family intramembrane serine protease n=1 Tax=Thioclava sediminum TaxID=1915319 RepID=A0ABX3N1I5_9RHOB|nr:rhomboid family intramembrane serine protease [Thioclava sediminum]OOY24304.1 rhomboid family intramembrane serine protease [Thioclava sediminum]
MFPIRDHNPSYSTPWVTWTLIAINIVVYVFTAPWGGDMRDLWLNNALWPAAVTHGVAWHGLFTHMFLHAGILHLAGNMLFLWVFGDNLEDRMGRVLFLIFYLACGLAAAFAQIAANPNATVPMVGASGAIAGVMGGYLLLYPKARIDVLFYFLVFFKIWATPAWLVLGLWFAIQLFNELTSGASGGVAHMAHIGGFVAGALLTLPLWYRLGGPLFWRLTHGHPPFPEARERQTNIPTVTRRR